MANGKMSMSAPLKRKVSLPKFSVGPTNQVLSVRVYAVWKIKTTQIAYWIYHYGFYGSLRIVL